MVNPESDFHAPRNRLIYTLMESVRKVERTATFLFCLFPIIAMSYTTHWHTTVSRIFEFPHRDIHGETWLPTQSSEMVLSAMCL